MLYDSVRLFDVDETWTLTDLVKQATTLIAALPAPKNGQVRAVPDERTIRYYATLGLLDRPVAMRGRTALYGLRHLAQVVAIKRLQTAGRSLAEIQAMWPTLDDGMLARMTGVMVAAAEIGGKRKAPARPDFWKREPVRERDVAEPVAPPSVPSDPAAPPVRPEKPMPPLGAPARLEGGAVVDEETEEEEAPAASTVALRSELRIELAPDVVLAIAIPLENGIALEPADVRALRAAAASLVDELAKLRLGKHVGGEEP